MAFALFGYGANAQNLSTCPTLNDTVNTNVNPTDTIVITVSDGQTGNIARIGGADEDITDDVKFTIGGTDAADFSVTPSTFTTITGKQDFADLSTSVTFSAATKDRYDFTLTLEDDEGLSMTAAVAICVNQTSLDSITYTAGGLGESVFENDPNTSSFPLSVYTVDINGNVVSNQFATSWTILQVNGSAYNASTDPFSISGNNLVVDSNLDFETTSPNPYTLLVQVQSNGQTLTQTLTVEVLNVNEPPYVIFKQ